MTVAEYFVDKLIEYGVTDTFGIPGGVVLKLLAVMDSERKALKPHLNYHEQMAGFAACGYAQKSGRLGVAYATRGPGITNMITCIAEAYQESLPVLFITAHAGTENSKLRFENNQELNIVSMVSSITKYAASVDSLENVQHQVEEACDQALDGRRGPVLLDFASFLWDMELKPAERVCVKEACQVSVDCSYVLKAIEKAKRPIILLGDGIRHSILKDDLNELLDRVAVPVLSSRGSQDIAADSKYYYGYVGSHGTRYSNYILSKCDLIISVGNRLAFPLNSMSFAPVFKKAELIRVDIDENEFLRRINTSKNIKADAESFLKALAVKKAFPQIKTDWINTCAVIKNELQEFDCTDPVLALADYMAEDSSATVYVADVGNNEFWVSRAYEKIKPKAAVLFSKSFGTLGVALGRAIGAYYASKAPVVCIIGDQGFQCNIQELQFIYQWQLPIKIIVLNNSISGMILDHEKNILMERLIHVTQNSGYRPISIEAIARAYCIAYTTDLFEAARRVNEPIIYEIQVDSQIGLTPNLPKGNSCQDMEPLLDRELFEKLNSL